LLPDKNKWEAELIQVSIIYTKNLAIVTSRAMAVVARTENFGRDAPRWP